MASINIIQVFLVYFTITTVEPAGILYPFDLAAGDTAASPPKDDHCYGPTMHTVVMFGKAFNELYVCSNGVISLDNPYKRFSTAPFPLDKAANATLIAPFWTDADLSSGGKLWKRETTDAWLLTRASEEIKRVYSSAAKSTYKATWMLIATWEDVVPFTAPGRAVPKGNTFQAVIISDATTYYVIFNYEKINWVHGSGSPKPAQVGFDSGDGKNYYATPNSRTPSIINITLDSNVGIPGRMIFSLGSIGSSGIELPDSAKPTSTSPATSGLMTSTSTLVKVPSGKNPTGVSSGSVSHAAVSLSTGRPAAFNLLTGAAISDTESQFEGSAFFGNESQSFYAQLSEVSNPFDTIGVVVVTCTVLVGVILIASVAVSLAVRHCKKDNRVHNL